MQKQLTFVDILFGNPLIVIGAFLMAFAAIGMVVYSIPAVCLLSFPPQCGNGYTMSQVNFGFIFNIYFVMFSLLLIAAGAAKLLISKRKEM